MGCVLHDMIQPSFSFLVGVALPFPSPPASHEARPRSSLAPRARAVSDPRAALGSRCGPPVPVRQTGLLRTRCPRWDWVIPFCSPGIREPPRNGVAFAILLIGYWGLALYPVVPDFDYASVGVSADRFREHGHTGFAAHWQKNGNFAWAADQIPELVSPGQTVGYNGRLLHPVLHSTLATMVFFGLLAGSVVRDARPAKDKLSGSSWPGFWDSPSDGCWDSSDSAPW